MIDSFKFDTAGGSVGMYTHNGHSSSNKRTIRTITTLTTTATIRTDITTTE
jgi:hypothetical protein